MSSNLHWKPTQQRQNRDFDQLKYILGPKLWGHDGSLNGEPITVGDELIPFLEGVAAVGQPQAQVTVEALRMIELIRKHGTIDVWIDS